MIADLIIFIAMLQESSSSLTKAMAYKLAMEEDILSTISLQLLLETTQYRQEKIKLIFLSVYQQDKNNTDRKIAHRWKKIPYRHRKVLVGSMLSGKFFATRSRIIYCHK